MTPTTGEAARLRDTLRIQLEASVRHQQDGDDYALFRAFYRAAGLAPAPEWLADPANEDAIFAIWQEERQAIGLPPGER